MGGEPGGGAISIRKQIVFVTLIVLVAGGLLALGAEGLVRLRQWAKYGTAAPLDSAFRMEARTGLRVPDGEKVARHVRINSLGFRSPELADPKPVGTIRVAFLGASTTYSAEVSSNEATWPHLVWQALKDARPRIRFDYLNAAVPGYTTEASLRNLLLRVKPLQPDVIVFYEATNDLAVDTLRLARGQGLVAGDAEATSWPARYSMLWFLVEKNLTVRRRQAEATQGGKLVFEPRALSRKFEQRLEALVSAGQASARAVVLVTFAPRLRRGASADEQREAAVTAAYYMPYMSIEGLLQGYDEYNRVIRDVAHRTGAVLVEAEGAIPGDRVHYADSVHLTDAGSRALAQVVAQRAPRLAADRSGSGAGEGRHEGLRATGPSPPIDRWALALAAARPA